MQGGHLRMWEIGDGSAIQIAEYATPEAAIIHNVHIKGSLAYIAYYSAGVRVVDVSDPTLPREVGAFDTSESYGDGFTGCWGVYPYTPSGLVYASDLQRGLFVLRYLDNTDSVVRGTLHVEGASAARVAGAEMKFLEAEVRVVSDANGYFEAKLYPGVHTARIRHPGFAERRAEFIVNESQVTTEAVELRPLATGISFPVPPGLPVELPDGRWRFTAQVRGGGREIDGVILHYRAGASGSFRSVELAPNSAGDESYLADLPAFMPGTMLQYYFEAQDAQGQVRFAPEEAPQQLFAHDIGQLAGRRCTRQISKPMPAASSRGRPPTGGRGDSGSGPIRCHRPSIRCASTADWRSPTPTPAPRVTATASSPSSEHSAARRARTRSKGAPP